MAISVVSTRKICRATMISHISSTIGTAISQNSGSVAAASSPAITAAIASTTIASSVCGTIVHQLTRPRSTMCSPSVSSRSM